MQERLPAIRYKDTIKRAEKQIKLALICYSRAWVSSTAGQWYDFCRRAKVEHRAEKQVSCLVYLLFGYLVGCTDCQYVTEQTTKQQSNEKTCFYSSRVLFYHFTPCVFAKLGVQPSNYFSLEPTKPLNNQTTKQQICKYFTKMFVR